MSRRQSVIAVLAAGIVSASWIDSAFAADWPGWRGPNRDGKSPETGLLAEWPAGGPPLAWRASGLGGGYSSLAVVGERIYTLGDQGGQQNVLALERATGKTVWKTAIGPGWEDEYGGSRSTPTVDGALLYALSTEGKLVCLETATGKEVWSRSLPADFAGKMMDIEGTDWKFSESPLVDGDRVLVTPGSSAAAIVALDKKTGKELWRAAAALVGEKGANGAAYSSIVISHGAGVKQYVQLVGRGLIGVDAASGKLLWSYNRVANNVANIPTPLIDGDLVFASSGYGTGAALLKLEKQGDGVAARELYFLEANAFQNHHGNMILHDGHVYAGSGHNKGFPISLRLSDGQAAWGPIRNEGQGSAAVAFAEGRVYMRYQNGLMVLIEASPAGYREKGSFKIPDVSNPSWSHPVVAGGKLYLREQDNLFCYDLGAAKAAGTAAGAALTR